MLLLFNESFALLTFINGLYSIIIMFGVHHCTGIKKIHKVNNPGFLYFYLIEFSFTVYCLLSVSELHAVTDNVSQTFSNTSAKKH